MKTLCKVSNVEKSLKRIVKAAAKPRYICGKCGRLSKEKVLLCKPLKIPGK